MKGTMSILPKAWSFFDHVTQSSTPSKQIGGRCFVLGFVWAGCQTYGRFWTLVPPRGHQKRAPDGFLCHGDWAWATGLSRGHDGGGVCGVARRPLVLLRSPSFGALFVCLLRTPEKMELGRTTRTSLRLSSIGPLLSWLA